MLVFFFFLLAFHLSVIFYIFLLYIYILLLIIHYTQLIKSSKPQNIYKDLICNTVIININKGWV